MCEVGSFLIPLDGNVLGALAVKPFIILCICIFNRLLIKYKDLVYNSAGLVCISLLTTPSLLEG